MRRRVATGSRPRRGCRRTCSDRDWNPDLDPATPGDLRGTRHAELLECGVVQPGEEDDVVEGGRRAWVDVDQRPRRTVRVSRRSRSTGGARRPRSSRPMPAPPDCRARRRTRSHRVGVGVAPTADEVRCMIGPRLVPEASLVDPVRETVQIDRPVVHVRQHRRCHAGVVADQIALGDRPRRRRRRDQDLVEVGDRQCVLAEVPVAARLREPSSASSSSSVGPHPELRRSSRCGRQRP